MNKRLITLSLVAIIAVSCKQKTHSDNIASDSISVKQTANPSDNASTTNSNSTEPLDINNIPITNKLTGEFPYFKLPPNYHFTDPRKYDGPGEIKDYDKEYFLYHGTYFPMEGKTFKAGIRAEDGKTFSTLELQKNFDLFIKNLGGAKINNGEPFKDGEVTKAEKQDPSIYSKNYDYSSNNWTDIHTYVLRTKEKTIFIQVNFGDPEAYLAVLETKPFESQMSQTSAAEIKKEIDNTGKAILNINFETDKATLLPDGLKIVNEITEVLTSTPDLKLSIQGYTDNSGNKEHNKQLSTARANTVLAALIKSGIDKNRLKASGFGDENPLVPNDTEENKAKNRRVELVKL